MARTWLEARLYWGDDLEAVTYTPMREGLALADLGLPALPDSGDVLVELAVVAREERVIPRRSDEGGVFFGVLLAALLHAAFGIIAFHGRAAAGEDDASARAAMMTYAAAIDARAHERGEPRAAPADDRGGEPAEGKTGVAGNPTRENDAGRSRDTRGALRRATRPDPALEDLTTFGMLSIVAADRPGEDAGSSPWANDLGPSAMGNMFGVTIDDAAGFGGLGLTGGGEGGGGKGKGVALGGVATSGFGTCAGCSARAHGAHAVRSIVLRCPDCTVQVSGRLPPEAIQRVVRASFGRFRACYERGLMRDPSLEGRVATKFVIARDGSVAMASSAESSLPDANVTKCVERAFYDLTFPEPEGGIVTVVYPFAFSTSP